MRPIHNKLVHSYQRPASRSASPSPTRSTDGNRVIAPSQFIRDDENESKACQASGVVGAMSFVSAFISGLYLAAGHREALIPLIFFGVVLVAACVKGNCNPPERRNNILHIPV